MWVALGLERSDEYLRWRTCRVASPRTPRSCLRRQTQNRWHQPCYWLPFHSGIVPSGSQSLLFEARFVDGYPPTSFGVTLGGQSLSVVPLLTTAIYTLYGADIHTWADQTAELALTAFSSSPHISNAYLTLDAIQFSDQSIPEPSVLALSALSALLIARRVLGRFAWPPWRS
jgi:hypothetical protein